MTRPTKRTDSTFLTFRKRVPTDVLAKAKGQSITIQFPADALRIGGGAFDAYNEYRDEIFQPVPANLPKRPSGIR